MVRQDPPAPSAPSARRRAWPLACALAAALWAASAPGAAEAPRAAVDAASTAPTAPVAPAAPAPASAPSAASAASAAASGAPQGPGAPAVDAGAAGPLPYGEAVAARFPDPEAPYRTPGLAPGREAFTSNAELADALRAIVARGAARLIEPAVSVAGEPLMALHFGHGDGRPVVLLIGQQHGNEPAGAEALLVVAQRLADPAEPLSAVLDRVDVVVLPRVNPDGAHLGRRRNAAGLDINRDHLLLATPEARGVAGLAQVYRPVLVVDLHEYTALGDYVARLGALKRHDLLVQFPGTANLPPAIAAASEAWFRAPLAAALDAQGLRTDWYHVNAPAPSSLARAGLAMGGLSAGLARNAGGLRHAVTLLLETRGFDLGRLHIQRRVHTHVQAVGQLLYAAAERAGDLRQLRDDADAAVAARACRGGVAIEVAMTPGTRALEMLDPLTGADVVVDVAWSSALRLPPRRERARPCGYWLGADQAEAVARLRLLGVRVDTLPAPRELAGERYVAVAEGRRPDADGGTVLRRVAVSLEAVALSAPPGSHLVPLDQPLAHLAVAALEPDGPDSYFAHGLVGALDRVVRWVAAPP